jgi:hypothetical protein
VVARGRPPGRRRTGGAGGGLEQRIERQPQLTASTARNPMEARAIRPRAHRGGHAARRTGLSRPGRSITRWSRICGVCPAWWRGWLHPLMGHDARIPGPMDPNGPAVHAPAHLGGSPAAWSRPTGSRARSIGDRRPVDCGGRQVLANIHTAGGLRMTERARWARLAFRLVSLTAAYNAAEAVVALWAGRPPRASRSSASPDSESSWRRRSRC